MKLMNVILALCIGVSFSFAGIFGSDKSPDEQRAEALNMSHKTLEELYGYAPSSRREVTRAYGYAVFSSTGIHVLILSNENGSGVAHDNKTGKNIYMNMLSLGTGFGLGVKEFHAIFIFEDKSAFDNFVTNGWTAGAQVDVAAQVKDQNQAAANAAIDVMPGVLLYKMTDTGLALQATIQGYKYWRDSSLN